MDTTLEETSTTSVETATQIKEAIEFVLSIRLTTTNTRIIYNRCEVNEGSVLAIKQNLVPGSNISYNGDPFPLEQLDRLIVENSNLTLEDYLNNRDDITKVERFFSVLSADEITSIIFLREQDGDPSMLKVRFAEQDL